MTIQAINTGTSANSGNGDSIRTAFAKVNSNFSQLNSGLSDVNSILSQFTSTISFPLSGSVEIGSHLLPKSDLTYDLGSTSTQWRSLYVGTSTIYLGGIALSIADGTLTVDGNPVVSDTNGIFYGSGADSGDGSQLDTIKLIPDVSLYQQASNQYVIIDPTQPNHIHVRAGGTIDASTAELYLGGEHNHVRVNDNGYVTVAATTTVQLSYNNLAYIGLVEGSAYVQAATSSSSAIWNFQSTGTVVFPDNTIQNTAWAGGRVVSIPTSSTGTVVDVVGDLAFDSTHLYYCTATFTDGQTNIWKRITWSADVW
jgi:hypothetical protein